MKLVAAPARAVLLEAKTPTEKERTIVALFAPTEHAPALHAREASRARRREENGDGRGNPDVAHAPGRLRSSVGSGSNNATVLVLAARSLRLAWGLGAYFLPPSRGELRCRPPAGGRDPPGCRGYGKTEGEREGPAEAGWGRSGPSQAGRGGGVLVEAQVTPPPASLSSLRAAPCLRRLRVGNAAAAATFSSSSSLLSFVVAAVARRGSALSVAAPLLVPGLPAYLSTHPPRACSEVNPA